MIKLVFTIPLRVTTLHFVGSVAPNQLIVVGILFSTHLKLFLDFKSPKNPVNLNKKPRVVFSKLQGVNS